MQAGAKNPPWARPPASANTNTLNHQYMDPNAMITQQGMMPFQQATVYNPNVMQQSSMSLLGNQMQMNQLAQTQLYNQNVSYPTPRSGAYQNTSHKPEKTTSSDQRVFTGTITKALNNFGFVDEDVFYQVSVCSKGQIPIVGDRVLVEAVYNPSMPFKWNATRVQVLPQKASSIPSTSSSKKSSTNSYNAVPPASVDDRDRYKRTSFKNDRPPRREVTPEKRKRSLSRTRSPPRRDARSRESPERKKRIVSAPLPKYMVRVPKTPLDIKDADVITLTMRYPMLYIPSDFFHANINWGTTFPAENPFPLNNPCQFHIMSKDAPKPDGNDTILEPPDADYSYSVKVMLLSLLPLEQVYQKCGLIKTDDKRERDDKSITHPTRLIKFLVGHKGKGSDNFAIGGPWSPSLDGPNPDKDPSVLIKTATRTVKALTGIDLAMCTQWYQVVEFNYWRANKERLEKVVLMAVDVWSAVPTPETWEKTRELYKNTLQEKINVKQEQTSVVCSQDGDTAEAVTEGAVPTKENATSTQSKDASHYSKLDLKTIKVDPLRKELEARGASTKGLRAHLVSRLSKLLKMEEAAEKDPDKPVEIVDVTMEDDAIEVESKNDSKDDVVVIDDADDENKESGKSRDDRSSKPKDEKEKERDLEKLKSYYDLPSTPHIIVHPSATAKAGKFGCSIVTLSLLLDYRIADNKEHNFELFVFAELFNEMLMRDFGFYIYKQINTIPEDPKTKEKENGEDAKEGHSEDKEKKEDKDKKDEKEKKDDKDKKEDKDRKDDRDKKRDRERDRDRRRRSTSTERSQSPSKRKGPTLATDPYLALALAYFDITRCCYMDKKDLQTLLHCLGLKLSRSQLNSAINRATCGTNYFNYKQLMESVQTSSKSIMDLTSEVEESSTGDVTSKESSAQNDLKLARGNLDLINSVKDSVDASEGPISTSSSLINYKSRMVDIEATLTALSRSEARHAAATKAMNEAKAALRAAKKEVTAANTSLTAKESALAVLKTDLAKATTRLSALTASSKIFHNCLKEIQFKVESVVNIKYEEHIKDSDTRSIPASKDKHIKKPEKTEEKKAEPKKEIEKEVKKDSETKQESTEKSSDKKESLNEKDSPDKEEIKEDEKVKLEDDNKEEIDMEVDK